LRILFCRNQSLKLWLLCAAGFDLLGNEKTLQSPAMKFAFAILIYLIIAVILGVGILEVMAGKPWFLAAGAVAFIGAFGRIGCMPKKPH
jgi:membrane protein YdbS with pleckstrin-like domain